MQHGLPRSTSRTRFPGTLALAAALLLLLALACGRKGDPRPRSELTPQLAPPPVAAPAPPGR